ncbi:acyl-CoA dehydrogenase family protein [Polynucleobacter sp. UK-Mo-2m-Kol15]|uniref:acyl-CoA dehydrogenase family protein n=1 Tax=Polynucleobacter sp. UK-Mo-2m-Kol15 TaxID=2576916 RepID=UPI001C0B5DB4|nr:acyl-CoA dehydrogenase [Polynucleobacter sp. UK-Mo-2m-Kol15]MBU3575020.1 acyl-CoA dehydrogenase [Polynucleobacter sp. UK-Mo-2m-Kol15]
MNFELTSEQQAFADAVGKFALNELAPGALERAHSPHYPWEIASKLSAQGLLGIALSEKDGGQGGTLMDAVIAIQEVAMHCPKSADVVQAGNFGAIRTFAEYASEQQKEKFLPDLLAGKKILGLGMSEPGAGSAVTELQTSAKKVDGGYLINGSKVFSTHSPEAGVFLIYLRFGPGLDGIGSVLVERGADGLTIGQPNSFMSGEEWSQLYFEDCFISDDAVLLGPGGFKKQISGFNIERIGNSSRALALGRYAFNKAKEYASVRKQFGKDICEFQGIQWKFAEMAVKLDAAQLLLYRAAVNAEAGLPSAYETTVAKLMCNNAGFEVANEALQVMGATGYSQETLVEYCVRRTRGWMIAGGSIEILKNRIAEEVFERRFNQRA